MATTMFFAVMVFPLARVTTPAVIDATAVLRYTDVVRNDAASCSVICPMPFAGTAESPVARVRKMMSNMRRDDDRLGSSCIPPTNERKNRSIILLENPMPRSADAVGMS